MVKNILLSIFLISSLFANEELLDVYKKNGLSKVEKILDYRLTSTKYWEKKLQDLNTSFGYFESIDYILACDKNTTRLKLYASNEKNSAFKLNNDFLAFVGKRNGDKQKEGDLKTPIGVYKLLKKLEHVDEFYGPLAYLTSYPNVFDKTRGKNGSGIWIHGLPLNGDRDNYTKGCIAINNDNIKQLEKYIDIKKTALYIDEESYPKVEKNKLVTILSQLYAWRFAWKNSEIEKYLNFYDENFKRSDGMNKKAFSNYKKRVFAKNEYKQILFTNINIHPYPVQNVKDIYLVTFHEEYESKTYKFSGEKELYIHLDGTSFTILAEL